MRNLEKRQIENIVLDWARAVSAGDRDGILARHADDLLMFDFPNTVRGIAAYDKTWDFFTRIPGNDHLRPERPGYYRRAGRRLRLL